MSKASASDWEARDRAMKEARVRIADAEREIARENEALRDQVTTLTAGIREHREWIVRECGEESANEADERLWALLASHGEADDDR